MGIRSRAFLAASLGFAVSFVVACGGGNGLLSADQSSSLSAQLNSVSSAVDAGQCGAATRAARDFSNQVANLPAKVSTTLVQNLGQGAATIGDLAAKSCHSATTPTTTTSSTKPATTATVTTTTTATVPTSHTSSTTTSATTSATNPTSPSTTTTIGGGGNGGAGFGGTGTGGNGSGGAGSGGGNGNGQ